MHTNTLPTDGTPALAADPAERRQIARFHAALFPTRLALARWQNGGHIPHLHHGTPALRAAWYGAARRDFQAWLDRGGFSQYEEEPLRDQPRPPRSASLRLVAGGDAEQVGSCT